MSSIFLTILNLTLNASWLILAVIIARLLLKKAPKWIMCFLWGLVAIRLLCPISIESALSLLPSGKVVPGNIEIVQDPHIDSGVRIIDNAVNPVIERSFAPTIESSANPMQIVVFVASIIWLIGVASMIIYALISFFSLKKRVRGSYILSDSVCECDEVDSPFILGIFRPMIYVPSGYNENTLELVIAHEEAHLKRHDHWWKPLGFALLAVYWFNPLSWVAYILLCRDIETACDEKVIKDKDRNYMAAYSQALLDCSARRRIIAACPLAFGETGVKGRIKGVLSYKKPAFWMIVIAIIVCIVVTVCFMTNPKNRYYDITVRIPAGSKMNTVWFSDEEVSPQSDTLILDTGEFYTGTLIIQAIDGNTDVIEQTSRLQYNKPVTFQVQPGVWYRVGLRMGIDIDDNDLSLKIRVRNAELRIASESNNTLNDQPSTDESGLEIVRTASEETQVEVVPSEDTAVMTYETFNENDEQGPLFFYFESLNPFPVNDPETGLELYVQGSGVCFYDLGDTEYDVNYIWSVFMTLWKSRVSNAIETNGYSDLMSVSNEISEDIASDLQVQLGLRNVSIVIISYTLTEESQTEYDAVFNNR